MEKKFPKVLTFILRVWKNILPVRPVMNEWRKIVLARQRGKIVSNGGSLIKNQPHNNSSL